MNIYQKTYNELSLRITQWKQRMNTTTDEEVRNMVQKKLDILQEEERWLKEYKEKII
jgi:uncharacterized protein YdcH (DUF465 family)